MGGEGLPSAAGPCYSRVGRPGEAGQARPAGSAVSAQLWGLGQGSQAHLLFHSFSMNIATEHLL